MSFVGGWYSAELLKRSARDEFEAAKSHIAMTKGAGADVFIVAETSNAIHGDRSKPLSERPRLHKGDWAGYGAKMTEFAERLADEGLKLCYHHHMGTIIQSERDIDALMAHTKAARASAARHGTRALGRLRSGSAGARLSLAHRPCTLQGRARGDRCANPTPAIGASSIRS